MSGRLNGKVALITGAAQGIGEAIARVFVSEGAYVYLSDIHDDLGKKTALSIGKSCQYFHLSVEQEEQWDRVTNQIIKETGHLDILVNNAGVIGFEFGPQDPETATLESWKQIHAINADSVFLGCKKAIQIMKEGKGSIVNVSSRSGLVGVPGAAAYASSKASTRNHTKSVALYCCQKGYDIRCNSVHPAAILTPLWDAMLGEGEERKKGLANIERDIPMHKMGDVNDVAYAVLFLASDEAKYITGTELNIDGGLLAGSAAPPGKN